MTPPSRGAWEMASSGTATSSGKVLASLDTAQRQARLEEVANAVYHLCYGNPTSFPNCNHGMAILGLLELMTSQGATLDEMFEAANYANVF